jgi:hypothetical protein
MRISSLLWMSFVTGCGSIEGAWEGDCEVQVGNDLYTYEVELEIESIEKGDINGIGTLYDEDNNRSRGTLDGSKEGSVLDFDIAFDDGVLRDENFEIDAKVDGREIDGDCSLGGQNGLISLERMD